MSGSSTYTPKRKCDLVWPKSQESQDTDDSACQGSFMLGWWSHDQLLKIAKAKVVALHCSFLNLFELCSKVLPLWRYEMKNVSDDFNIVRRIRDRATIIVSWEIWPKKGSVYLERDNDTDRLQSAFLQEPVGHQKVQGWGAYVLETEYQNHIANYIDEAEVSSYPNIWDSTDLWQINACKWSTAGYAVSGAVLVICSRHCLIHKNRAGDLKKGEK